MISYDATLAPAAQLAQRRRHRHLQQHWSAHSVGAWLPPSSRRIFSKDLRDIQKLSVHYPSLDSLFPPLSAASPRCAPASKISVRPVIPLMVARLSAGSGACCTTRMRWSLFSCSRREYFKSITVQKSKKSCGGVTQREQQDRSLGEGASPYRQFHVTVISGCTQLRVNVMVAMQTAESYRHSWK